MRRRGAGRRAELIYEQRLVLLYFFDKHEKLDSSGVAYNARLVVIQVPDMNKTHYSAVSISDVSPAHAVTLSRAVYESFVWTSKKRLIINSPTGEIVSFVLV